MVGSAYSITASSITLTLGAVRSILLARWIAPQHFGTLALALFFINLATHLRGIGLDMAVIHKQDADESFLGTYFSLRFLLDVLAFAALLILSAFIQPLYPRMESLAAILPALIAGFFLASLSQLQETFLRKSFAFNKLAATDVIASVVMTAVAPPLAWRGYGIWALVAEQVSGFLTRFLLTWGIFRPWKPRFGWDRSVARWLFSYGANNWAAGNLTFLLDRFDDFWIGTSLGNQMLGYYAKAYEFAHYPRKVIANQLVSVFTPAFAVYQADRQNLSKSFYRSAYLILRAGMAVSGLLALVMPEFIHYVIGDQWAPMLWTFRIMLIYTIIDPLLMLIQNFFLAIGRARELRDIAVTQALFFLPAVVLGAYLWGINGVAVAADLMLVTGILRAQKTLRTTVDFSWSKLIGLPSLAFLLGSALGIGLEYFLSLTFPYGLILKPSAFAGVFFVFLMVAEREDLYKGLQLMRNSLSPHSKSDQ